MNKKSRNRNNKNRKRGFFMINFRTDLASERRDIYKKANQIENEISGIESEKEGVNKNIIIERVKIINEEGENAIGKPIGNYVTVDVKNLKIARRGRNIKSYRSVIK